MKKPFVTPADFDGFITEAFNIEPGSGKLIFLPYIHGERAPVWDAEARGVFYGINGTHTIFAFYACVNGRNFICTLWNFK